MQPFSTMGRCGSLPPHAIFLPAMPLRREARTALSSFARLAKRRCEITIISFSRSICRGGLAVAALIGVTGKPYPSCLSCHSHPIRPCGAPSPRGEGCDTRIPSSKKVVKLPPYNKDPSTSVGMTGGRRVISHSLSHRCVDPSCAFGAPLL